MVMGIFIIYIGHPAVITDCKFIIIRFYSLYNAFNKINKLLLI